MKHDAVELPECHDRADTRGFSLIEVCIAIIILAVILTPLYAFLIHQKTQSEALKQEAANEQLLSALAIYVKANGAFPCPASLTAKPGDANFGQSVAQPTPGTCASGGATGVVANAGPTGLTVYHGAFPTQTTGLPFNQAANRAGFKYLYAVTGKLTNSGTYSTTAGKGGIGIYSDATYSAATSLLKDALGGPAYAQFVIVNPGDTGVGAWTLDGTAGRPCGTALDSTNCKYLGKFVDAPYAATGSYNDAKFFDDTLSYTLARKETTMWVASDNAGAAGGDLNITNRNQGNVGIGNFTPAAPLTAKLGVSGDVRVQTDTTGVGGNVNADKDVNSTGGNINAASDVTAGTLMQSPGFYYK